MSTATLIRKKILNSESIGQKNLRFNQSDDEWREVVEEEVCYGGAPAYVIIYMQEA